FFKRKIHHISDDEIVFKQSSFVSGIISLLSGLGLFSISINPVIDCSRSCWIFWWALAGSLFLTILGIIFITFRKKLVINKNKKIVKLSKNIISDLNVEPVPFSEASIELLIRHVKASLYNPSFLMYISRIKLNKMEMILGQGKNQGEMEEFTNQIASYMNIKWTFKNEDLT
ncbi:MAG: hypothetical protein HOB92_07170, partial [Candidatus Cloacimonetes bacterium]|nr:hypothetical protein [Candidatus Cloacimonadota bacterium]